MDPAPRYLFVLLLAVAAASNVGPVEARDVEAEIRADVVYGHKDGLAMTMDVYRPAAEANGAGILFIASGGWFSRWSPPETALPLFHPFLDAGYTVFRVRHGSSPRYSIPEAIADATRSVRFVRANAADFGVDPERLGALGNSAGGHLALILGTKGDGGSASGDELARTSSRVAAVVAWVPPTDLTVAVWEAPESLPSYRQFPALDLPMELAAEASPLQHVTPDDAPSLVIMGGADELVPPRHGEWIAEAFDREGVANELVVIDGAGHGLGGEANAAAVFGRTIGWFDRHLSNDTVGADSR